MAVKPYSFTVNGFGAYLPDGTATYKDTVFEQNISHRAAPYLRPTPPSRQVYAGTNLTGITYNETLCFCDGGYLYINGQRTNVTVDARKKTFVTIGRTLVILPDKLAVSLIKNGTQYPYEQIDVVHDVLNVTLTPSEADGSALGAITRADTPPTVPTDGQLWMDISVTPNVLRKYNAAKGVWQLKTCYVKLSASDVGVGFKANDGVVITGGRDYLIEGNRTLSAVGTNYIVFPEPVSLSSQGIIPLTVERTMPETDVIICCQNRLWGCRYGRDNAIYASAPGDPINWTRYDGTDTDSVTLKVGSTDTWTGATAVLGMPVFFKENSVHKIYGSRPSDYSVQEMGAEGLAKGAEKSIGYAGGKIYYKSPLGVTVFDGSRPASLVSPLDGKNYSEAIGCAVGGAYTLYVTANGKTEGYVFGIRQGTWHRLDETGVWDCCTDGQKLYTAVGNTVYASDGTEDNVLWSFETGPLWLEEGVRVCYVEIRLAAPKSKRLSLGIRYDGGNTVTPIGTTLGLFTDTVRFALRPKDCRTVSLCLNGQGDCTVCGFRLIGTKDGEAI